MPNPFGISNITDDLTDKSESEVIDHLYREVEKCSDGDINNVRTLLISLFAASIVGLSEEETGEQVNRIFKLLKLDLAVGRITSK